MYYMVLHPSFGLEFLEKDLINPWLDIDFKGFHHSETLVIYKGVMTNGSTKEHKLQINKQLNIKNSNWHINLTIFK